MPDANCLEIIAAYIFRWWGRGESSPSYSVLIRSRSTISHFLRLVVNFFLDFFILTNVLQRNSIFCLSKISDTLNK